MNIKLVSFAVIVGAIFGALVLKSPTRPEPPKAVCQPLPTTVAAVDLTPEVVSRRGVPYAGLQVKNLRDTPVVFVLTDLDSDSRLKAVTIPPQLGANLNVPVGNYGAELLVGQEWCNLDTGFLDGRQINLTGKITVEEARIAEVSLAQNGLKPEDIAISLVRRGTPNELLAANGDGVLQMEQDGHFYSDGTVNGVRTRFIVDTGASMVAISRQLAIDAGIRQCNPIHASTANGRTEGCLGILSDLTFGPYRLQNVEVIVMPDLPGGSLLGMNVLRQFKITQDGQEMVLAAKSR